MAGSGVIEKTNDPWRTDYRYRGLDPYHVLEAMGRVVEYALEHPDFKVLQANWRTFEDHEVFVFEVVTGDDQIKEAFCLQITKLELQTREALIQMMDIFRKNIINWWETRHKMIAKLLGQDPNMCEFYPRKGEDCGGVCGAGSELGGRSTIHFPMDPGPGWQQYTCSREYSETCPSAIKARKSLKGFGG